MTTIIHDGVPHVWVQSHQRGDSHVIGHWRPAPIGAGSTYPEDAHVMGAEPPQGFAPFTNPNERDTLPGGRAS